MQREQLVVGVVVDDRLAGREQLGADEQREQPAEGERGQHAEQVHDADALVIEREDPRQEALVVGEVVVLGAR